MQKMFSRPSSGPYMRRPLYFKRNLSLRHFLKLTFFSNFGDAFAASNRWVKQDELATGLKLSPQFLQI